MIPHFAVVGDVRIGHQEAVTAHHGATGRRSPPVQSGELADDRSVTDLQGRVLALVLEVLRIRTEHCPVRDCAVLTHNRVPLDQDPGTHHRAVPDRHTWPDQCPRSD